MNTYLMAASKLHILFQKIVEQMLLKWDQVYLLVSETDRP